MKRSRLAILVLFLLCLMLAACSGTSSPAGSGSSAQQVKINIGDFYIHLPVTTFMTGTNYQFVVTNVGTHHHDFLIMHPMETMTMTMD